MAKSWAMKRQFDTPGYLPLTRSRSKTSEGNMTVSIKHPAPLRERRLAIARRLFRAMVAKDPDRSITFCDSSGEVVARHNPRPEQDA